MEKTVYIILGAVLLVALSGIFFINKPITGMVTPGTSLKYLNPMMATDTEPNWYKIECIHHIMDFFKTEKFVYPQNDKCAAVIEETCDELKKMKTSKLETFETSKPDAYKIMIFEVSSNLLGKITLKKGFENPDYAKMNIDLDKTIITIKGWDKTMELDINLEGRKKGNQIFWESGNIKAEDFECSFGSKMDVEHQG